MYLTYANFVAHKKRQYIVQRGVWWYAKLCLPGADLGSLSHQLCGLGQSTATICASVTSSAQQGCLESPCYRVDGMVK